MPRIINSNPQNRVKDCFATAPKIDLVLRTNGEERVSVISSLGDIIPAGFDSPLSAPSITISATTAVWDAGKYWNYVFAFVAKQAYPLVENAITGGGSVAPRSNPSPSAQTDSNTNANKARIINAGTTSRADISHIWIYRTVLYDTVDEAQTAADAGNAFWIGEVQNNANVATVPFVDTNIESQEQVETDNFSALQGRYCVFDGNFFWVIGNDPFICEVDVSSTGFVTIVDQVNNKWFDGRNGQVAIFTGITSGGSDNYGNFYIKILSNSSAQVYQDIGLTQTIGVNPFGRTQITIKGQSTILYRSKIRNPFSWGYTDIVNDVNVPTPYNYSLGGGRTTSLAIIPNLNLLKIDTEGPNRTFTLNLKNAGTPNFETSLRPISDTYCSSVHSSQFSATDDKGRAQLWSLDSKSFAIVQCDGSSQTPVSDPVYKTLRTLSLDQADRDFFHGNYLPRVELNCMFVRSRGVQNLINLCLYQHWPTNQWGMVNVFDLLCSAQILDPYTNEQKLFVGTVSGNIGEFAAEDQYWNWTDTPLEGTIDNVAFFGTYPILEFNKFTYNFGQPGVLYNWMLTYLEEADGSLVLFGFARIAKVEEGGSQWHVTIDQYLSRDLDTGFPLGITGKWHFHVGVIELIAARFFNASLPFETKKVEEVLTSWMYSNADENLTPPGFGIGANYRWDITGALTPTKEVYLTKRDYSLPKITNPDSSDTSLLPVHFTKIDKFSIDQSAIFGIMVTDRNYTPVQLMNYEIRLSSDAPNNGRNS